jgi:hypothetical protein
LDYFQNISQIQMTTPDSFLNGDAVNSDASWTAILQNNPFKLSVVTPSTPPVITLQSTTLWSLTFSNRQNPTKFGSVPAGVNDASTENDNKDAVFGLVPPTSAPAITFGDATTRFGITTTTMSSELAAFVALVDPSGSLALTLDPSPTARSAVWALSGSVYRTDVSLVFQLPVNSRTDVMHYISTAYSLAIDSLVVAPRLTLKTITTYTQSPFSSTSVSEVIVDIQINGFQLSLIFGPASSNLRISNPPKASPTDPPPPGTIFDRLNAAFLSQNPSAGLKSGDLPNSSHSGTFNKFLQTIDFWYLLLTVSTTKSQTPDSSGNFNPVAGPLNWQINLIAEWQSSIGAVVAFQYDSSTSTFSGRLLFNTDVTPPTAIRQYDYDWQTDLANATTKPLPAPLDLWKIFSSTATAPKQIPHLVVEAELMFTQTSSNGGYSLGFSTTAVSDALATPPGKSASAAPEGFSWDMISVNALFESSTTETLTLQIFAGMSLNPKPGSSIPPAELLVSAMYVTNGSWNLHARAYDITFPLLYSYLHSSVQNSSIGILQSLSIKSIVAVYTFDPNGDASSFFISGTILLGDLELDLSYEYASSLLAAGDTPAVQISNDENGITPSQPPLRPDAGKEQWTFAASLGAASPGSNLGKVVASIAPNAKVVLPSFVAQIPVNDVAGNSAVRLIMRGTDPYTAVSVAVAIGDFNVTFVSLNTKGSDTNKTVLRVALDQIPLVNSVPLIKSLPQPCDKILYLWLDDDSGFGLSQAELDFINGELSYLSIAKIDTKDSSKDPSLAALRAGHHFMVEDKGKIVLDHVFGDDDANSTPTSPDPTTPPSSGSGSANQDSAPTKGALDKQLPFLSISAVSLLFKHGVLGVELDATVTLGPIQFSLIQFDLGIQISSIKLNDLSSVTLSADLHGLSVDLDEPPVLLAGAFIHDTGNSIETYKGGISFGFEAWKFLAVGEYAIVNNGQYKSVFVYAKLDGPLFSLGFATVSGVRVGLGYNSAVRTPTITELPSFPFLTDSVDSDKGDDPLSIIKAMTDPPAGGGTAWVSPKQDSYWVVAVRLPL